MEGIGYPTVKNKNSYALFEKINPEIASIVLYVDVDVEIIIGKRANINQSNNVYLKSLL